MGQEGDAGVEEGVPALRAVILIFQLLVGLFEEGDAVVDVDGRDHHFADEALLKYAKSYKIGEAQGTNNQVCLRALLTINLHFFVCQVLLECV